MVLLLCLSPLFESVLSKQVRNDSKLTSFPIAQSGVWLAHQSGISKERAASALSW